MAIDLSLIDPGLSHAQALMQILLLQVLVFLASFLLFQIELILGKLILPGFGGGYLVWGLSVVFYQALLMLGYVHLHFLNHRFPFQKFARWQLFLLFASLVFFPIDVHHLQNPSYQFSPAFEIILLLGSTIGLPFFLLAGLSIFAQLHLTVSTLPDRENPYILYASSNLGAFLALLSYPFAVEPFLDLTIQLAIWQAGYVLLACLCVAIYKVIRVGDFAPTREMIWPKASQFFKWVLFAAAPSALFLAITNLLSFDVAPFPLLWVLPLSIYLLTLTLAFKRKPFCPRWIQDRFYFAIVIGSVFHLMHRFDFSLYEIIIVNLIELKFSHYAIAILAEPLIHLGVCFVFCLVCHYRLNEARPKNPQQLTGFYIAIALGGFLGGVVVNWIVPLIFDTLVETIIAFLLGSIGYQLLDRVNSPIEPKALLGLLGLLVVPMILWPESLDYQTIAWKLVNVTFIIVILFFLAYLIRHNYHYITGLLVLLVAWAMLIETFSLKQKVLFQTRNFYGIYKVYDKKGFRYFDHGTTLHGAQYLDPKRKKQTLTYYHKRSPMGEMLGINPFGFSHVGLVGLGAGSLALYCKPGQEYDFYELDPLVGMIAQKYFTFIKNGKGKVNFIYGDARLSLRRTDKKYDALIIDVFNSDAIPVHLITLEAIREYQRNLKDQGIIFFHVSNQYLDLVPPIFASGRELRLFAGIKSTPLKQSPQEEETLWLALTADLGIYSALLQKTDWVQVKPKQVKPWTDRYSSILSNMF